MKETKEKRQTTKSTIKSNKTNKENDMNSNNFNLISKMTDIQLEENMRQSDKLDSLSNEQLAESYTFIKEELNELITLDDGRTIYWDDKGYYMLKSNNARQSISNLGAKQLIKNQSNTQGNNMKPTIEKTQELSYKDYYETIATKIEPEQIISDFELEAGAEIYLQEAREHEGRFYSASYFFKYENQVIAVNDVYTANQYKIRTNLSDMVYFMIVRNFVNDGQIELPKRASRVIPDSGDKVYQVKFFGGNYDVIMSKGKCVYANKPRPSQQEQRNTRLAQLKNFKKNLNEKKMETEIRLCSQEDRPLAEKSNYDG